MIVALNYHIHTKWSDGEGSPEDIVREALSRGLEEIAITDHLTILPRGPEPYSIRPEEIERYLDMIDDLADRFGGRITVRRGMEVDYIRETKRLVEDMLSSLNLDLILGSIHFVDGICIDKDPHLWREISQEKVDKIYSRYYELLAEAARSDLFDIVAHFDLPKKYGRTSDVDPLPTIEEVSSQGLSVKINTSGLRYTCREMYPSKKIVEELYRRGVTFTVGTDAHRIEDITSGISEVSRLVEEHELTLVRYSSRIPIILQL